MEQSQNPMTDAELLASVSRPDKKLLVQYMIMPAFVVAGLILFFIVLFLDLIPFKKPDDIWAALLPVGAVAGSFLLGFVALLIRFYTLKYQIDDQGIRKSEGLINRKESYLTFARVQDIHLDRTLLDRWMGIGTISVQTASGQATPEAKLIGLSHSEEIRDALYRRLRKVQGLVGGEFEDEGADAVETPAAPAGLAVSAAGSEELTALLSSLASETARLRDAVEKLAEARAKQGGGREGGDLS